MDQNRLPGAAALPVEATAGAAAEVERAIQRQALDAQVRMLPYALGFFGICLPVFVTFAAHAPNAAWIAVSLGVFGLIWAMFYAVVDWLKRSPEAASDIGRRTRVQLTGGVLWSLAIVQTTWFSQGAGPLAEPLLILCGGAAAGVMFFSSPVLPSLLVNGAASAAAPVIALELSATGAPAGRIVLSGLALAMALCLILNRHLREHFTLTLEREGLIEARERALGEVSGLARSKSLILATLSHEVRNGLSGVIHVLGAALGVGPRAAPSRDQLKAALHAARDLVEVLDATLDSETADSGALSLTTQPIDLPGLAAEVVTLHRAAAAAKGLELTLTAADAPRGAALGDAFRVRQILNNLVGNAVKYTLKGRIEVRIGACEGGRARVEVVDTGPGLTRDELERAFEPFSRVERTGAGIVGAGLGLSLSRRLAALMRGEVSGASAPGVGSRFWLDLPFDPDAAPLAVEAGSASAIRPLRVLIVEDDGLNAAMLRAVLEQLGHRVLHAQNGARAIELLRMGDFDLVMLDGRMPEMDGPETARRIRALDRQGPPVAIVGVIGGDADEAQSMLEAGADAVLRKPVSVASVARAVADAAASRSSPAAKAAA